MTVVWAESRSRGRAAQSRIGSGAPRASARRSRPGRRSRLLGAAIVAALALGFPLGSLGYWLAQGRSADLDPGALAGAAVSTISVSALGAALTTALAIPVGIMAARYRSRRVRALEQASYAGHALPGIVVGLSLVFFGVRFAYPIYQRTPLLVLAYAVCFCRLPSVRCGPRSRSPHRCSRRWRVPWVAAQLGSSATSPCRSPAPVLPPEPPWCSSPA